jgi:hypothetical protein
MKRLRIATAVFAAAASLAGGAAAQAAPSVTAVTVDASMVTPISGGCGPNGWRGRWGHCHYDRWWGPGPVYGVPAYHGCPPGFWRGPWGHCRNTPYHGPLPGGGWK